MNIKKTIIAISLLGAVSIGGLGLLTACNSPTSTSASAASEDVASSIVSTSGTGFVMATPDLAKTNVTISITKDDAITAQNEASKLVDKVIEALIKAGAKEEKIKTQGYYLNPEYDYIWSDDGKNGQEVLKGYRVSHNLSVEDIKSDEIGKVLKAAVEAGATRADSVSFYVSDEDSFYKEALEKAVADARSKAEVLAKAEGKKIVNVKLISEGYSNTVTPFYSYNTLVAEESLMDSGSASVKVPSGESKISANVTVSFVIE